MKKDSGNAVKIIKHRQKQNDAKHSLEKSDMKTAMKKDEIQNKMAEKQKFEQPHVEQNSSIYIAKPLILQKIKRENG